METSKHNSLFSKENRLRNLVLIVVTIGVLMSAIDSTIVVLAIPSIDTSLNTFPAISVWVILAYIFMVTVFSTHVGRLGDIFGRSKIYNIGFLIFTISSLFCGLANNITTLIALRVIQGIGGAFITANSSAVVSDYFDVRERGKVFGITNLGWMLGAVIGVILGGFLIDIDWRWIFLINVPIGLIVGPIGLIRMKDVNKGLKEKLDIVGSILLALALLLISFSSFFIMNFGLEIISISLILSSLLFTFLFIIWEIKERHPLLDISLFNDKIFTFSIFAGFLQFTASFSVLFFLTLYLQGIRQLDAFHTSLVLLPGYLLGGIMGPFMGRIADRIGSRIPATLGLALLTLAYVLYAILLNENIPLFYVSLITLLSGAGSSLFFPANIRAVMVSAPAGRYGVASGIYRTLNNVGMVLSFAISLNVASISIPRDVALAVFVGTNLNIGQTLSNEFLNGIRYSFIYSAVAMLIAAILSSFRGKEKL